MSGGPSLGLDMRVSQRLEQRPVLSLQTIQSLKLLQLATVDLQALINHELEENPTLEASSEDPAEAPTEFEREERTHEDILAEQSPELTTETGETYEEVYDFLQKHTDFEDRPPRGASDNGEPDSKQEAFAAVTAPGRTLADHLLEQLRLREIDELDWPLLEQIVYSLDARGYLTYPLEDIVKATNQNQRSSSPASNGGVQQSSPASNGGVQQSSPASNGGAQYTLEEAQWALSVIQSLEPKGVGARDLAECLLLQIGKADPDYDKLKTLLTEHWDDVLKNRIPRIAKAMSVDVDEVKLLIEMLGTLNPQPGSIYSTEATQIVTPDVIVEEAENGEYVVRLTRENLPRLSISPTYLRMLEERAADKEALSFIKGKINHARQLIEALQQRQSTLERVANSIVKRQPDYLRWGTSGLKPMKMQDIADELGIHHSTVWRAVYGKYMQTRHGIVAMNELFTGGLPQDDGETSREAVKLKVKEFVDNEDKRKPLSDMAIAKKLADSGIQASRRVVTKYREELGIADSRVRREH
jgi:RNA polymerase sigma-54 factor